MDGYLVAYEYGSGAVWGFVRAGSVAEVRAVAPEVEIHADAPSWMTTAELTELRHSAVDIDAFSLDAMFKMSQERALAIAG